MPRRFDRKTGWNRQFKWKPLRRDRWDPFPKDHLPFIDDFSVGSYGLKKAQVDSMRKRKADDMLTPTTLLGKRQSEINTGRRSPPATRQRSGSGKRSLFTNDSVAALGTVGVGAAGMAYTAAGIGIDSLNARITAGIEEGFAAHAAARNAGVYGYDVLTEAQQVGRILDSVIATGERILPLVEDLLVPLMV